MASSPMWKRAQSFLRANPDATARHLQEALGCTKMTAVRFITRWRQDQTAQGIGVDNVIALPKTNNRGRIAFEDLPPSARASVVARLNGILEYIALTNQRMIDKHEEMNPLQHSQMSNALANAMTSLQKLTDTYPGLSAIVATEEAGSTAAATIAKDLERAGDWLGTA